MYLHYRGMASDLAHRLELAGLGSSRVWLAQHAAFVLWQSSQRGLSTIPPS